MGWANFKLPPVWSKIKYWLGYSLFVLTISYGLWYPPPELWQIKPGWLLLAALIALAMFFLQGWQVMIFLKYHHVQTNWLYPALFTARKGVLNAVLPAKSGTFALLPMLTKSYQLKWHDFIKFILIGSIASLLVSLLGAVWLLFPLTYTLFSFLLFLLIIYFSIHYSLFIYATCFPSLLLIAFGLFISTIFAFYCLLRGLNFHLSIVDISHFAVALNVLAQISITPGNVGVRELVVGIISPYVCLPVSVGIIASAVFYFIRLTVYSVILFFLEYLYKKTTAFIK